MHVLILETSSSKSVFSHDKMTHAELKYFQNKKSKKKKPYKVQAKKRIKR